VENNHKILKIGSIAIVLTICFSVLFGFYCKLDNPVFFKQYCEYYLPMEDNNDYGESFYFQYVTNVNDNREVVNISFNEAPELILYANENNNFGGFAVNTDYKKGQIYGRYSIRTVNAHVNKLQVDNIKKEYRVSKATVWFNNGENMEVDIGDIYFYTPEISNEYLQSNMSSSSTSGESKTGYRVKEDITLESLSSPLMQYVEELVDINIEDTDYRVASGIQIKKGGALNIKSVFRVPKDIESQFTFYNIKPVLNYKNKSGEMFSTRVYNINYVPTYDINFYRLILYLRERGQSSNVRWF
jgi:hypothetical protein